MQLSSKKQTIIEKLILGMLFLYACLIVLLK